MGTASWDEWGDEDAIARTERLKRAVDSQQQLLNLLEKRIADEEDARGRATDELADSICAGQEGAVASSSTNWP